VSPKAAQGVGGHVTHSLEAEKTQASLLPGAKSVLGLLLPYATFYCNKCAMRAKYAHWNCALKYHAC